MSERFRYSNRAEDGYYHLGAEPEITVGLYRPGLRVMGMVAASAAAKEFLQVSADVIAGSPPDAPPPRPRHEDLPEDEEVLAKAA
jgi:hypothetical protein